MKNTQNSTKAHHDGKNLASDGLEKARKKLLDLSARNRLLNFKHTNSAKILRLIDEVPDQIYQRLVSDANDDPKLEFLLAPVPIAKKSEYSTDKQGSPENTEEFPLISLERVNQEEMDLSKIDVRLHAKKLGIAVDYHLPRHAGEGQDKHQDNKLQTLLYPESLDKVVRRIQSEARTAIEESGVNMLFLCLGFLKWSETDTSDGFYHAPLITIPIALERKKVDSKTGYAKFYLKYTGEDIFDNICLREKLKQFSIELPNFEDFESPEKYFTKIESLLKKIKPKWGIDRFATIGFLSFGKMLMYLDLDPARWPAGAGIADAEHIADIFEGKYPDYGAMAEEFDIDGDKKLPRLPLVLDADSSQHSAIIDVLNGKNIVIEGPPGTGKSQTITNLIAACLANGKSVLFVAEKLTALEVVRKRLDASGLGAFCLELHSHKTQKKTVLADIKNRLDINTDACRHSLKDVETQLQELDRKKKNLIEYDNAINTPFANIPETPHEILWKTEDLRRNLGVEISPKNFPSISEVCTFSPIDIKQKTETIKDLVDSLSHYFTSDYHNKNHFWHGFTTQAAIDYALQENILESLGVLQESSEAALAALKTLESVKLGEKSFSSYIDLKEKIDHFSEDDFIYAHFCVGFSPETLQTQLEQSLTAIQNYAEAAQTYSDTLLKVELKEDLLSRLASIENVEMLNSYRDCTLNDANAYTQKIRETLRSWEDNTSVFHESIQNLSMAGNREVLSCYLAVNTVADVISAVDAHTLSLRSQALEDAVDSPLLESLFTRIKSLKQQKITLKEQIIFERLPDLERLHEIREILARAGVLKNLSSQWRKTHKEYAQFAKNAATQNKENSVQQLDVLIAFMKDSQDFENDAALNAFLPNFFKGLETNTDALIKAKAFYCVLREQVLSLPIYGLSLVQKLKVMDKSLCEWIKQQQPNLKNGIDTLRQLLQMAHLEEKHDIPITAITANAAQNVSMLEGLSKHLTEMGMSRDIKFGVLADALESRARYLQEQAAYRSNFTLQQLNFSEKKEKDAQQIISQLLNTVKKVTSSLPSSVHTKILCQEGYAFLDCLRDCAVHIEIYQKNLRRLGVLLNKDVETLEFWGIGAWSERTLLVQVNTKLQSLAAHEQALGQWCDVQNAFEQIRQQGLSPLIKCFAGSTPEIAFSSYIPLFYYLLYWNLSNELMQKTPVLANFSRIGHENIRDTFQQIDVELQRLNAKKLAWEISRRSPPKGDSEGKSPKDYKNMQLILHELSKKKRHVPIRHLVGNAFDALVALKPCFMMGPLSVAQYLDPHNKKFDVVIMDEASQIKPEDALGVLARAKQVVVVGDSNQLPPTSFFDKLGGDTDDEEDITTIEDSESILDVYKPVFQPNRRLRWHYRSQHQSLISFSNHHFYENDLIIFPSSTAYSETVGVKHVYVHDGVYKSQSNPIEAAKIVFDIVEMIEKFPRRSYGIVTLNAKQKMVVEDEVERVRKNNSAFDAYLSNSENTDEPFFIKNLEGVQGDERDVIFISTTFGPDENGAFRQNFGPINGANGWRRLNVLFTRAKQHVRIYSSFMPERIKVDDTKDQRGLRSLRDYLQFAITGIDNHAYLTGNEPDSDFERAVGGFLKSQGYEIVYQLGVAGYRIDLVVKNPVHSESYAIAIECDGATYHSAKSARDRDRLREENLKKLGWKYIHRIWSTDWFRQREKEEKRLLKAVEMALTQAPTTFS